MGQIKVSGQSPGLAEEVARWIQNEWRAGARIFALEGLMASGKTTLATQIVSCLPEVSRIELDDFLQRGRTAWSESLQDDAAEAAISAALATSMLVLVVGAIAWPTVTKGFPEIPARRMYLKRMQFPGFWADEGELTEFMKRQSLRVSVRDYHAGMPWLASDLVIERLVDGTTGA